MDLQATASSSNTTAEVIAGQTLFYTNVDGAKWFLECNKMLEETSMHETGWCALKIMNLLQPGEIEKGADSIKGRYKYCNHVGMV